MLMRLALVAACLAVPALAAALPRAVVFEPVLTLPPSPGAPRVALTLDACDGAVDHRILDLLIARDIPATIFASGRWIARNPDTLALLLAHPALFEVEDHGARHVPAIDVPMSLYGLHAAGSPAAVATEVTGGTAILIAAGAPPPKWFRGAGAEYDASAEAQIHQLGYRLAGFSLNGDGGASLSEAGTRARFDMARDGAVILAHLNQPHRPAGAGVAAGIDDLLARGYHFVRLDTAFPVPGPASPPG